MKVLAIAALAALAIPAAAAAPLLTAQDVQTTGPTTVEGTLLALLMESGGRANLPTWSLQAERLRLEVDYSEPSINAGAVWLELVKGVTFGTNTTHLTNATVRYTDAGAGFRVNVYGHPGATVTTTTRCSSLAPPDRDTITRLPWIYNARQATTVSVDESLVMASCAEATLTIRGDFMLSAWDTNLEVESREGNFETPTGRLQGNGPDARPFVSRSQEAYLFARNANLTIAGLSGPLYLASTGLVTNGEVELTGAAGSIPALHVDGVQGNVKLQGRVEIQAASRGVNQTMSIVADGEIQSLHVDGRSVPLQSVMLPVSGSSWPLLWLAMATVLAGLGTYRYFRPLAVYYKRRDPLNRVGATPADSIRQRRGMGYWALGNEALNKANDGDHIDHANLRRAQRYGSKASRLYPDSLDVQLLEAMVPHHQGQFTVSFYLFKDLLPKFPGGRQRAGVAILCGEAAMFAKGPKDAVQWLKKAAREDYQTFRRQVDTGIFDSIKDPWLQSIRSGVTALPPAQDPAFS